MVAIIQQISEARLGSEKIKFLSSVDHGEYMFYTFYWIIPHSVSESLKKSLSRSQKNVIQISVTNSLASAGVPIIGSSLIDHLGQNNTYSVTIKTNAKIISITEINK